MKKKDSYQQFKSKLRQELRQDNPYERYGLLSNPFPKAGEPTADPLYNQEPVVETFERMLLTFFQTDGNDSSRLLIYGDHRVGKTNFLLHWRQQVERLLNERVVTGFHPIYLTISADNFVEDVYGPIITELSKDLIPSFFEALRKLNPNLLSTKTDLDRAIHTTIEILNQKDTSNDEDDTTIRLFTKWFSGERCAQSELKMLGGLFSSIDTSSLAIKYFRDFVNLARQHTEYKGVIIFMDEFELIFGSAVTSSKRARYLQDLRHFIDMLEGGILLVVASSSAIYAEFQREYPAIKNRFSQTKELSSIKSIEQARGYAEAYIDFARAAFQEVGGKQDAVEELLTPGEIEECFAVAYSQYKGAQGMFLAELHRRVEDKVRS